MFTEFLQAGLLGLVEGITEFLPVSSTGHLILAGEWLQFTGESAKTFKIFIQLGAIFAVVFVYRKKIFSFEKGFVHFWSRIFLAFLPAAVIGLLFHDFVKMYLFQPIVVAVSLIIGGLAIFLIEGMKKKFTVRDIDHVSWEQSLCVGLAQVLALIPGVSRSASTILGGVVSGLDRKSATEFSFFLAIPTMFAATLYDLYKSSAVLTRDDIGVFAVGFFTAFVSAIVVIKLFLRYVSTHDFRLFAWYRIVFGLIILAFL